MAGFVGHEHGVPEARNGNWQGLQCLHVRVLLDSVGGPTGSHIKLRASHDAPKRTFLSDLGLPRKTMRPHFATTCAPRLQRTSARCSQQAFVVLLLTSRIHGCSAQFESAYMAAVPSDAPALADEESSDDEDYQQFKGMLVAPDNADHARLMARNCRDNWGFLCFVLYSAVVIIGDGSVGKTSVAHRFASDSFEWTYR